MRTHFRETKSERLCFGDQLDVHSTTSPARLVSGCIPSVHTKGDST